MDEPLLVQLPPHMANFFAEVGYIPAAWADTRTNARVRVRCEATITIHFESVFAKRAKHRARVLVKDLSRSGISILSHQQMWPNESFSVELYKRKLEARVVRCQRLGKNCYDVGAVIFSIAALPDADG